jgi:multidrug resistance efflux pump
MMTVGFVPPAHGSLPALRLVQSSRNAQRLARVLLVVLVLSIVAMALLPWQQSARGTGKVVAYVPQERQQTVTSPVKGIAVEVNDELREGSRVASGTFIVEIEPQASNLSQQLQSQLQDMDMKLTTSQAKADAYAQNVIAYEAGRDAAVSAADELIQAAKAKWDAKKRLVPGYEAKVLQAQLDYDRQKALFEKGVKPEKEIEKLRKDLDVAQSDLESAQLDVVAAQDEWEAKKQEREQKLREAQAKVDYSHAMKQDALGQMATAQKEKRDLEVKLAELDRMVITAPRDGTIFRMPVFERGQAVKEGDPLFTIVPDTSDRVVELWISGNDIPLVKPGDHVRLQFEGWPAVQFAGWPSVAVGTFGGEVAAIDACDDGKGSFRVQVKPDSESDWPSGRYLRQGVRANGWVMLGRVRLSYEIWRQLNGFPPSISSDPSKAAEKEDKTKVPLPK